MFLCFVTNHSAQSRRLELLELLLTFFQAFLLAKDFQDFPAYPPEAVEVRNTFIHVASPGAQNETCSERPVLSCPASQIGFLNDIFNEDPDHPDRASAIPAQPEETELNDMATCSKLLKHSFPLTF